MFVTDWKITKHRDGKRTITAECRPEVAGEQYGWKEGTMVSQDDFEWQPGRLRPNFRGVIADQRISYEDGGIRLFMKIKVAKLSTPGTAVMADIKAAKASGLITGHDYKAPEKPKPRTFDWDQ
jgi:hypothetical protein